MGDQLDAVIIGGGFYGCITALYLKQLGYDVVIIEREADLLTRASYANQARVHNGYHYPRSFMTAWRSLTNFPRFVLDFAGCVDDSFEKVYAIARRNSKVSAYQFKQFCHNIGAPIRQAPANIRRLFDPQLIEEVFIVKEYAFDAVRLREMMQRRIEKAGVAVRYEAQATHLEPHADGAITVHLDDGDRVTGRYLFNCTYAQINVLLAQSGLQTVALKHQIAEIALVEVPEPLRDLGITVMDGPFFSVMPFPADGLHSFSHVRYTHHETWYDEGSSTRNPYQYLRENRPQSRFPYMLRDAQRYMPVLQTTEHQRSLFEIKSLLMRNEIDDGRPILFHEHPQVNGLFSILGGKIDNVFDLLQNMQQFTRNLANAQP